jgi:hypothetical protein
VLSQLDDVSDPKASKSSNPDSTVADVAGGLGVSPDDAAQRFAHREGSTQSFRRISCGFEDSCTAIRGQWDRAGMPKREAAHRAQVTQLGCDQMRWRRPLKCGGKQDRGGFSASCRAAPLKTQEGRRPDARQEHSFLDFTLEVLFLRP